MSRRDFVRLGSLPHRTLASEPKAAASTADFMLRIAPMIVELAPHVVISTIGYSNEIPGPLLRVREGQRVCVEVVNDTDVPEYVHWHGLFVPSDVDGVEEEGTTPVPPHGRRRYQFVANPAGSRWYHSHTEAMLDLHRGSYTGQFGFLMIVPRMTLGSTTKRSFSRCVSGSPI
jgi:FtsP/CotA-like multicopper oxidase with cupredoxin domain